MEAKIIKSDPRVVPMHEMNPFDVGIVRSPKSDYNGDLVMRTSATSKFEVMDLTTLKEDHCWTNKSKLPVELLPEGTIIQLTL